MSSIMQMVQEAAKHIKWTAQWWRLNMRGLAAGAVCAMLASGLAHAGSHAGHATVAADGSGRYATLQAAVDALPESGGVITIAPGTYREKVTISKTNVHLAGSGKRPQDVLLVFDANAGAWGGTGKTATLTAVGDGFEMRNMTVQNDWSFRNPTFDPNHHEGAQAVALMLRGDKDVVEHVRLLGAQDTLYAGGGGHCVVQTPSVSASTTSVQAAGAKTPPLANGGACRAVRQLFRDCYIEGHIDFIFGDANAVFENCEIHGIANEKVWLTAQSKDAPERQSAYVFDHCRVTADAGVGALYLGRPWRRYGTVVFLDTALDAKVEPAGWDDWVHTPGSIETAYFAEYNSTGVGANPAGREKYSHQLTDDEAKQFAPEKILAGSDGWRPLNSKSK
ncbi:MAG: pectinesterase family protein [Acidobacteriaceae bacterium]|nr:pectinesterase family protein [Acidobacteriaceae bacterium]